MKIVINAKYGGFGISIAAVKRIAELQGRPVYFFKREDFKSPLEPITEVTPELERHLLGLSVSVWDIPNPEEIVPTLSPAAWVKLSDEERRKHNELHEKHCLSARDYERNDPLLVRAVEELGEAANGQFAALKVVEIPDGVEWQIEEYDGYEHIAEKHQTWS